MVQENLQLVNYNQKIMNSSNIDQNALLKHVAYCFQCWEISDINKDLLKQAHANTSQAHLPLKRLLFHLCVLAITQYRFTIAQLGIQFDLNDEIVNQEVEQFILAFLSQVKCPYTCSQNSKFTSINFHSSRSLLIICGWLMAVTNFFEKIRVCLVQKLFTQIYIDPPVHGTNKKEHKIEQTTNNSDLVLENKFKMLKQYQYKVKCYEEKKEKLLQKLNKRIASYNKINQSAIRIEHILASNSMDESEQKQVLHKVNHLYFVLEQGIKGMRNQQYFWVWLQMKPVEAEMKQLRENFEEFQKRQVKNFITKIHPNPNYLRQYLKVYQNIQEELTQINSFYEQIEHLLDGKKPKKGEAELIEKVVQSDFKKILRSDENMEERGTPCFLSIEMSKYLQGHGFGKKKEMKKKENKQIMNGQDQLKIEINDFLSQLEAIKFI